MQSIIHHDTRREMRDESQLAEQRTVFLAHHHAAAGREHRAGKHPAGFQHALFQIAKVILAVPRKNLRDLHPAPLDDERVRIDELKSQPLRDEPSDRRLAAAHEADEDDVCVRDGHGRVESRQ